MGCFKELRPSRCWLIKCTQEHVKGARLPAFHTATCDVIAKRCIHWGHVLMQSLSDCLCRILMHSQATCGQYRNYAQQFMGAQNSTLSALYMGLRPMLQWHHHLTQSDWCWWLIRWKSRKCWPGLLTNDSRFHLGSSGGHGCDEMERRTLTCLTRWRKWEKLCHMCAKTPQGQLDCTCVIPTCRMRKCQRWKNSLLIMRTMFWTRPTSDVISSGVSEPISATRFVFNAMEVVTVFFNKSLDDQVYCLFFPQHINQ